MKLRTWILRIALGVVPALLVAGVVRGQSLGDGGDFGFFQVGPVAGTTTNNNAAAGYVGEVVTGTAALDSVGSWSTNTAKNVTSISLTAGDWDVWGQIAWAGATTGTYTVASISTTSATLAGDETTQGYSAIPFLSQANSRLTQIAGPYRASLSATTTIYLVGQEGFAVGTPAVGGTLRARRVR